MSAASTPAQARVMLVADDPRYSEWLRHHLDVLCPQASVSMLNLAEFERWCTSFSGRDCDLLMLAVQFGSSPEDPQSQGLALLRRLREQPAAPAVIAIAEDGNELTAVRALQLGAVDYLPKRLLTPERLEHGGARRAAARRAARGAPPRQPRATSRGIGLRPRKAAAGPPRVPGARHRRRPRADGAARAESVMALLTAANPEVIPGYTLRLKIGESEKAVVYLAISARAATTSPSR